MGNSETSNRQGNNLYKYPRKISNSNWSKFCKKILDDHIDAHIDELNRTDGDYEHVLKTGDFWPYS